MHPCTPITLCSGRGDLQALPRAPLPTRTQAPYGKTRRIFFSAAHSLTQCWTSVQAAKPRPPSPRGTCLLRGPTSSLGKLSSRAKAPPLVFPRLRVGLDVGRVHSGLFPSYHVAHEGAPWRAALGSRSDATVLLEDQRESLLERVDPLRQGRLHLRWCRPRTPHRQAVLIARSRVPERC